MAFFVLPAAALDVSVVNSRAQVGATLRSLSSKVTALEGALTINSTLLTQTTQDLATAQSDLAIAQAAITALQNSTNTNTQTTSTTLTSLTNSLSAVTTAVNSAITDINNIETCGNLSQVYNVGTASCTIAKAMNGSCTAGRVAKVMSNGKISCVFPVINPAERAEFNAVKASLEAAKIDLETAKTNIATLDTAVATNKIDIATAQDRADSAYILADAAQTAAEVSATIAIFKTDVVDGEFDTRLANNVDYIAVKGKAEGALAEVSATIAIFKTDVVDGEFDTRLANNVDYIAVKGKAEGALQEANFNAKLTANNDFKAVQTATTTNAGAITGIQLDNALLADSVIVSTLDEKLTSEVVAIANSCQVCETFNEYEYKRQLKIIGGGSYIVAEDQFYVYNHPRVIVASTTTTSCVNLTDINKDTIASLTAEELMSTSQTGDWNLNGSNDSNVWSENLGFNTISDARERVRNYIHDIYKVSEGKEVTCTP
jgi:hypothetical protein